MSPNSLVSLVVAVLYAGVVHAGNMTCKCTPDSSCWPSQAIWSAFNETLLGKLIKTVPLAAPCYPGPYSNPSDCDLIQDNWSNSTFLANNPIGYSYPYTQSCGLPGGNTTTCTLGDSPVYAINASTPADVVAGVNFGKKWNLRLVVKTSGHDMLGRSTGYASLEIWLRYLRPEIVFEETYGELSAWNGSVIEIGAGYQWSDLHALAASHGVIVVGAGCPSVSVLGGFTQGGGHSRATRDFGLAADQLLEAHVVLTSGQEVLASPTSNVDLFRALRGGGGGTYGIVTRAKIKAYPDAVYAAFSFYMAPLNPSDDHDLAVFMEAIAILYEAFPALADGGLSGYGSWNAYNVGESLNTSMSFALGAKDKSIEDITTLFAPTLETLHPSNGTNLNFIVSYTAYESYWDYYYGTGGGSCSAVPAGSAFVSRLFTKHNLSNGKSLRRMLNITAGTSSEGAINGFALLGGGALFDSDELSGINPAWRQSYMHNYCGRGWADTADFDTVAATHHDITYTKGGAMRDFAPDTGAYMNEADWQDPRYLQDFYGEELPVLEVAKKKYDPDGVLYCPTCVGSENWVVEANGALCRVRSNS